MSKKKFKVKVGKKGNVTIKSKPLEKGKRQFTVKVKNTRRESDSLGGRVI